VTCYASAEKAIRLTWNDPLHANGKVLEYVIHVFDYTNTYLKEEKTILFMNTFVVETLEPGNVFHVCSTHYKDIFKETIQFNH